MISEMSRNLTNLEAKSTIWSQLKGAQAFLITDFLAGMRHEPTFKDIYSNDLVRGANSYLAAPLLDFLPEPCRSQNASRGFDASAGCGRDETRCTRAFRALPLLCILCYAVWTCMIPNDDVQANPALTVEENRNSSHTTTHMSSLTDFSSHALLDLVHDTCRYTDFVRTFSTLSTEATRSATQFADSISIQVIWWVESFRRGNSFTIMNYA